MLYNVYVRVGKLSEEYEVEAKGEDQAEDIGRQMFLDMIKDSMSIVVEYAEEEKDEDDLDEEKEEIE